MNKLSAVGQYKMHQFETVTFDKYHDSMTSKPGVRNGYWK